MPKTDIVGTIRVPEEHYGRFWNFMKSMPSCEFSPITFATLAAEERAMMKRTKGKTANGSTGKCILLRALKGATQPISIKTLENLLVEEGKSRKSVPNIIFELKKARAIKRFKDGSVMITPTGKVWLKKNCIKAPTDEE